MHELLYTTTRSMGSGFIGKRRPRGLTITDLVASLDVALLRCMVVQFSSLVPWCSVRLRNFEDGVNILLEKRLSMCIS